MVVAGVHDYRIDYKNYHDWIIPRRIVLTLFITGFVFEIVGLIFILVAGSRSGFASAGAVFLGLGMCLHLICLLLCLHAFCVLYIRDESTQTRDSDILGRNDAVTPVEVVVTSKPPHHGLLKPSGRSPVLSEPKRVRLQAERDTGFAARQSPKLLSERFPLRTPDVKDDASTVSECKQTMTTNLTDTTDNENHYESLLLKPEHDSPKFVTRMPGEVFLRTQAAEASKQVEVVYPKQVIPQNVQTHRSEAPPSPAFPPTATNIASEQTRYATYQRQSPFSRELIYSHPMALTQYQSTSGQYQHMSSDTRPAGSIQHTHVAPDSRTTVSTQKVVSESRPTVYSQQYHVESQRYTGSGQQAVPESQPALYSQQYHSVSVQHPVNSAHYYQSTVPNQQSQVEYRRVTSSGSADFFSPTPLVTPVGRPAGVVKFDEHRESKMSLYDNLYSDFA